jgi:hypothetical protein
MSSRQTWAKVAESVIESVHGQPGALVASDWFALYSNHILDELLKDPIGGG